MRYLFIFEDGSLMQADNFEDGDIEACMDGILSIVDMDHCIEVNSDGGWSGIEQKPTT